MKHITRSRVAFVFWILALTVAVRADSKGTTEFDPIAVEQYRRQLEVIGAKYADSQIERPSPDYDVLWNLYKKPAMARLLIPELINLTKVRTPRPHSSESFDELDLTPAGMILGAVGESAVERITNALEDPNVTPWQKAVLREVLRKEELMRNRAANSAQGGGAVKQDATSDKTQDAGDRDAKQRRSLGGNAESVAAEVQARTESHGSERERSKLQQQGKSSWEVGVGIVVIVFCCGGFLFWKWRGRLGSGD